MLVYIVEAKKGCKKKSLNILSLAAYLLKSRLQTARCTVNRKEVAAMQDTGCTGCAIRSSLVSKDQLLGKASDVTLINETTQKIFIGIDCPFFSGQKEALCMDNTLYNVVIGNIEGSINFQICPIFVNGCN